MSRSLLGVGYPLAVLATLVTFACVDTAAFTYRGQYIPRESKALWTFLFGVAWSWWVSADRQRNGSGMAFEFDALVFFAWPIVVPYYLVSTRAARSVRSSFVSWGLYASPFLVATASSVFVLVYGEP